MNVKPKFVYYDIRRKQSVCLIMYTHENDVDTQALEVSMIDNGDPIELSTDYTYSAAIVNRDTKALINDNISCELNESGNILIPIDNFHTLGAQDLLIELTITDSAGDQVLVTPFPLWIHVNASILDDAQVTPESLGTVPELLEEVKGALETVGDYENLENKPQINGHELVGDKSSDDLGLQGKLTAGENITINENGVISADATTDYDDLTNKPSINNVTLSGNKTSDDLGLQGKLTADEDIIISQDNNISIKEHSINFRQLTENMEKLLLYSTSLMSGSTGSGTNLLAYIEPNTIIQVDFHNAAADINHLPARSFNGYFITLSSDYYFNTNYVQIAINLGYSPELYLRFGSSRAYGSWKRLNIELSSVTVNQNGKIKFTMSDGTTITSTGATLENAANKVTSINSSSTDTQYPSAKAVYDAIQGVSNYTLTEQDKQDIADIVIARLSGEE